MIEQFEYLQKIDFLISVNRYSEAKAVALDGLASFPESTSIKLKWAEIEYLLGNNEACLELSKPLLEKEECQFDAFMLRSGAYYSLGQLSRAKESCQAALTILPFDYSARFQLALIYLEEGNQAKAVEIYYSILESYPEDDSVLNNLGVCFSQIGNSAKALEFFKKAVRANPLNDLAHSNISILASGKLDIEAALVHAKIAGSINPVADTSVNVLMKAAVFKNPIYKVILGVKRYFWPKTAHLTSYLAVFFSIVLFLISYNYSSPYNSIIVLSAELIGLLMMANKFDQVWLLTSKEGRRFLDGKMLISAYLQSFGLLFFLLSFLFVDVVPFWPFFDVLFMAGVIWSNPSFSQKYWQQIRIGLYVANITWFIWSRWIEKYNWGVVFLGIFMLSTYKALFEKHLEDE